MTAPEPPRDLTLGGIASDDALTFQALTSEPALWWIVRTRGNPSASRGSGDMTSDQARELRDWLNQALGEDA
jgi:hypothetical protein